MNWDFTYLFSESLFYKVLIGVSLIGALSGVVGTFSFLRKKSLVSDAISHSVLPGICVGFIYEGNKNPIFLIAGSLLAGLISVWLIDYLIRRTKISEDTAIAFASTFFFAVGSVMLSFILAGNNPEKVGLKDYLFGKAATISFQDIRYFLLGGGLILLVIIMLYRPLKAVVFNSEFAHSIGINVRFMEFIISVLTVLTVALGIQAVGVVLMSALLIAPAATARYWTNNYLKLMIFAALIGGICSSFGVFVSGLQENMPTGPWIVTFLFAFVFLTLLFAPGKGWISVVKKRKTNRRKIETENVLKVFYQLKENGQNSISVKDILDKRSFETAYLSIILKEALSRGLIKQDQNEYFLTPQGNTEAERIVRLHRLWELYLTRRMNFKEDHIHGTAETVEHLITPEIEAELLKELQFPNADPHNKNIPY